MYKVMFIPRGVFGPEVEKQAEAFPIFMCKEEQQALSFAISLHQACNIKHVVCVLTPSDDRILTLFAPGEFE